MVFTAKAVEGLPGFGEKIKRIREEAGLTKEKAAQLLNLPIKHLDRLEAGEIEKMPADVYSKGLLRKYAELLAVDGAELVAEYEKESRIARHLKAQSPRALPVLPAHRLVVTPGTLGWLAGAIVLFLVIGYFFYQLHFLLSPPDLRIAEPVEVEFVTADSAMILRGQAEPGVKLTINGQQSYIDKDGKFEQAISLVPGLNIIKVEATNRFGKTSEEIKRVMLRLETDLNN